MNSNCWAYSFDMYGISLGASLLARCSAWSHCNRSRRMLSASIGLKYSHITIYLILELNSYNSNYRSPKNGYRLFTYLDDCKYKVCARLWSPKIKATWPLISFLSSMDFNSSNDHTIPTSPICRKTRDEKSISNCLSAAFPNCFQVSWSPRIYCGN